jgi:hypothetical protein
MAVKYELDEDARDKLDRRSVVGRKCIGIAAGDAQTQDSETFARDAISDILTALFGASGYFVLVEQDGPDVARYERRDDPERLQLARTFLDMTLESWEGDAEDYTAHVVTE